MKTRFKAGQAMIFEPNWVKNKQRSGMVEHMLNTYGFSHRGGLSEMSNEV